MKGILRSSLPLIGARPVALCAGVGARRLFPLLQQFFSVPSGFLLLPSPPTPNLKSQPLFPGVCRGPLRSALVHLTGAWASVLSCCYLLLPRASHLTSPRFLGVVGWTSAPHPRLLRLSALLIPHTLVLHVLIPSLPVNGTTTCLVCTDGSRKCQALSPGVRMMKTLTKKKEKR